MSDAISGVSSRAVNDQQKRSEALATQAQLEAPGTRVKLFEKGS
jgi:hypothetical protein